MIIRLIAALFIAIGFGGFFMPFWIGHITNSPSSIELPMSEIKDAAISSDGHLYFALMFTGRIQEYSSNGVFVRNIIVRSAGGHFCINIIGESIFVDIARRDAIDELDLRGEEKRLNIQRSDAPYTLDCELDHKIKSLDHTFKGIKIEFFGDKSPLFIHRKLWHYLALGPFYSWLLAMIGLLMWPEWRQSVFRMIGKNGMWPMKFNRARFRAAFVWWLISAIALIGVMLGIEYLDFPGFLWPVVIAGVIISMVRLWIKWWLEDRGS